MSEIVISARGLSKRYTIGRRRSATQLCATKLRIGASSTLRSMRSVFMRSRDERPKNNQATFGLLKIFLSMSAREKLLASSDETVRARARY